MVVASVEDGSVRWRNVRDPQTVFQVTPLESMVEYLKEDGWELFPVFPVAEDFKTSPVVVYSVG